MRPTSSSTQCMFKWLLPFLSSLIIVSLSFFISFAPFQKYTLFFALLRISIDAFYFCEKKVEGFLVFFLARKELTCIKRKECGRRMLERKKRGKGDKKPWKIKKSQMKVSFKTHFPIHERRGEEGASERRKHKTSKNNFYLKVFHWYCRQANWQGVWGVVASNKCKRIEKFNLH